MTSGLISLLLTTLALAAACDPGVATQPSAHASPSPRIPSATAPASAAATTDPALADAIRFREEAGLRADPVWVRQVAADPAAADGIAEFGVPLMPDELETLFVAASLDDIVNRKVEEYGEGLPEVWAESYIDRDRGRIIAMFTADVDEHRAALRELVHPPGVVEVVTARWSLAEMNALRERIKAETDWLLEEGADLLALGIGYPENIVTLKVSSARSDIAALVIEHFDAAGMLRVTSDGTGVRLMPRGDLEGVAVDPQGRPVAGLEVDLLGDITGAGHQGDVGTETGQQGQFDFADITATGYEVRLFDATGPDGRALEWSERILVGRARVIVHPGETTRVTIVVTSGP